MMQPISPYLELGTHSKCQLTEKLLKCALTRRDSRCPHDRQVHACNMGDTISTCMCGHGWLSCWPTHMHHYGINAVASHPHGLYGCSTACFDAMKSLAPHACSSLWLLLAFGEEPAMASMCGSGAAHFQQDTWKCQTRYWQDYL